MKAWHYILIAVVAIAAIVTVVVVMKKKKEAKANPLVGGKGIGDKIVDVFGTKKINTPPSPK